MSGAVKDRYRKKCREKSKISRRGESRKNSASNCVLQRISLGRRNFVRVRGNQNLGASFGGL